MGTLCVGLLGKGPCGFIGVGALPLPRVGGSSVKAPPQIHIHIPTSLQVPEDGLNPEASDEELGGSTLA